MSPESQIVVPPSFIALFVPPGRMKPTMPVDHIVERHEHCEDLAAMLTEHAKTVLWQLGITEADVLERIHRGLEASGSGVDSGEATWVTQRLAELLEWPMPELDAPTDS